MINKRYAVLTLVIASLFQSLTGCARHQVHPSITAVGLSPANRCDPPGIPYYLPKPLLVISKNVRHIDESKVGLTGAVPIPGGFDNQAAYADIKANVTVPSSPGGNGAAAALIPATAVADPTASKAATEVLLDKSIVEAKMTPAAGDRFNGGVELDSFFTYQVIFVPDLSQKYGLQISGGAGEFRAAMNLVNGWMYTGMGPFYFKDSSSAQNAMATGVAAMYAGRGVADVVSSVGDLASTIAKGGKESTLSDGQLMQLSAQLQALDAIANSTPKVAREMLNYAEVYIYEPVLLPDQTTDWRLVAEHHFDRHYFDDPADPDAIKAKQEVLQKLLSGVVGTGNQATAAVNAATAVQAAEDAKRAAVRANAAANQFAPTPEAKKEAAASDPDGLAALLQQGSGNSTGPNPFPHQQEFIPNPAAPIPSPLGYLPADAPLSSIEINVNREPENRPFPFIRPHIQRQTPKIEQRAGNQQLELK